MLHETMRAAKNTPTVTERVRKHRKNLKYAGMRPIQIWVPDTRNSKFAEECRRQSLLIASDPHENEILDWIEQLQDTTGWK
jgi:hypothetical protein